MRGSTGFICVILSGFRAWENAMAAPVPLRSDFDADHLWLTIETVSRMLTRLDREKVIPIVPGGVRLLDPGGLARLAAQR